MTLKLYNTLTKSVEPFTPLAADEVKIYSCGPTVYDHAHIGNLSAFINADILHRVVANEYDIRHVMNFTDVDDKTIRRSREENRHGDSREALRALTDRYTDIFLNDMRSIGNDVDCLTFLRATDDNVVQGMRDIITELHSEGFAYVADDGVYFSIEAYKKSGKKYGQLVTITEESTSSQRIQNDEYDKESAHDFALWKVQKSDEPAWEFTLDGHDLTGRPGWHIECSVMSRIGLGQPFDIHTGGIDLAFPHHENEIAQSTAGRDDSTYASFFVHNEHVLVDNKKMSKSLGNFYTLTDIVDNDVDPLAFRMLVLQSHYRQATNFGFDMVEAAKNRLQHWRAVACIRHQTHDTLVREPDEVNTPSMAASGAILEALQNDLDTPAALSIIDETLSRIEAVKLSEINRHNLVEFFETIDRLLGLQLLASTPDIDDEYKQLIIERNNARDSKDWQASDQLRDSLRDKKIGLNDTPHGSLWYYVD